MTHKRVCDHVVSPAAVGGAPSDRGVDLWYGGEGQPAGERLPVLFPAHLRQAAVPSWMLRSRHGRQRGSEEGERSAPSLPGDGDEEEEEEARFWWRLVLTGVLVRQDGIKAAKRSLQTEIQTAVHKIYQQLSVTLERALQANKHHIGTKSSALLLRLNSNVAFKKTTCPVLALSSAEAQQRLLLVTVFALSVRYQPVDVSLAISSGLLNVLSQLCGTETMLGQPLQLLQKPGVSQLSTALKVASTRLLQILAISTG